MPSLARAALDAVSAYPYLAASAGLLLGALVLLRAALEPGPRQAALLAGLLNSPFALFSALLEGSYWSPRRLGGRSVGLEDLLVSFAVAAMAWTLAALVLRGRVEVSLRWRRALLRYLGLTGCGVGFYALAFAASADAMTALLACLPVAPALPLWLRPRLWPLAVAGAVTFPVVYFAGFHLLLGVLPGLLAQWNAAGVWGVTVLGVPRGELLWALGFGAALPVFVGYCVDARVG